MDFPVRLLTFTFFIFGCYDKYAKSEEVHLHEFLNSTQLSVNFIAIGGDLMYLECSQNFSEEVDSNAITWLKNDVELSENSLFLVDNGKLVVNFTTEDDAGIYTCIKNNSIITKYQVFLQQPYFRDKLPKSVSVYQHDNVEFVCDLVTSELNTTMRQNWTVEWFHQDGIIKNTTGSCHLNSDSSCINVHNGSLAVSNIQLYDQGRYTCLASSILDNRSFSQSADVRVIESPKFLSHWPHFYKLHPGDTFRLSCPVSVRNNYTLLWEKDGNVLDTNTVTGNAVLSKGKLVLYNVDISDNGLYSCKVTYLRMTIQQSTKLLVIARTISNDNKDNVVPTPPVSKEKDMEESKLWSFKEQVILALLCILTLVISFAATLGTMVYCHRHPQCCNQFINVCRIREPKKTSYHVQQQSHRILSTSPSSPESAEFMLPDSHDNAPPKLVNARLSFSNPAFEDQVDVTVEDHYCDGFPGSGDFHQEAAVRSTPSSKSRSREEDHRSLNSTCSEPYVSESESSISRPRQNSSNSL